MKNTWNNSPLKISKCYPDLRQVFHRVFARNLNKSLVPQGRLISLRRQSCRICAVGTRRNCRAGTRGDAGERLFSLGPTRGRCRPPLSNGLWQSTHCPCSSLPGYLKEITRGSHQNLNRRSFSGWGNTDGPLLNCRFWAYSKDAILKWSWGKLPNITRSSHNTSDTTCWSVIGKNTTSPHCHQSSHLLPVLTLHRWY